MIVFDGTQDGAGNFGLTSAQDDVRGVSVSALSSEDYFAVAAAGAGGFDAGIAGAVTVEVVDSDTRAYIAGRALIDSDSTSAHGDQDIHVGSANEFQFTFIDCVTVATA